MTSAEAARDPFEELAPGFLDHHVSVRGVVRRELVARQLGEHLPGPPARIVDIGGGAGHQSIPLAEQGHDVVIVDPSAVMIRAAQKRARESSASGRLTFAVGTAEDALTAFGEGAFDVVLCHGVLMYVDDPSTLVASLVRLARRGGIVSVLTKNGDALAMRSGLEGRYADAVAAFRSDGDLGRLGISTRADTLQHLADILWHCDTKVRAWYGVRIFSDHLPDQPPGADLGELLEAEWIAAQTDPYRSVGRLLHVVAERS